MSLKSILDSYDSQPGAFSVLAVGESIDRANRNKQLADDDQDAVRAEIDGLHFAERREHTDDAEGPYYRPLTVFPAEGGGTLEFPSLTSVTASTLSYWQQRIREAKHPVFRARYADLVWELTAPVTGKRPDHRYAQLVIDATLEIARMPVSDEHRLDVQRKLERALSLALSLNDGTRVASVRDAIVAFERQYGRDKHVGTWGFSFDLLIENKKVPVPDAQEKEIIAGLENRLASVSVAGNEAFSPWAAEAAALRLAAYYQRAGRRDDVARVLRIYAATFAHISKTASPLVTSSWLRAVHDAYLRFGLKDAADALQPSIAKSDKQSVGDMKSISTSIEISGERVRAFEKAITEGSLADSFGRIAQKFIVDRESTQSELLSNSKKFPLQFLFARHLLDAEGRTCRRAARPIAAAKLSRRFVVQSRSRDIPPAPSTNLPGSGLGTLFAIRAVSGSRSEGNMSSKNYHVVPSSAGGWDVRRGGSDRASSHHPKQSDAIDAGRHLAQSAAGELRIHGRDGRIRDSDSYGNDPFPPRDRKH